MDQKIAEERLQIEALLSRAQIARQSEPPDGLADAARIGLTLARMSIADESNLTLAREGLARLGVKVKGL